MDIIDPWPDVFIQMLPKSFRFLGKLFFWPFYLQLKWIIKRVNGITAISDTYVKWAKSYGKVEIPSNTYYPAVNVQLNVSDAKDVKSGDTVKFVYAGALSHSYDVETIIKAAHRLNNEGVKKIEFTIAGSGPKLEMLKQLAVGLDNVKFTGFLGGNDLNQLLLNSHVGIATYRANTH